MCLIEFILGIMSLIIALPLFYVMCKDIDSSLPQALSPFGTVLLVLLLVDIAMVWDSMHGHKLKTMFSIPFFAVSLILGIVLLPVPILGLWSWKKWLKIVTWVSLGISLIFNLWLATNSDNLDEN